MPRPLEPLASHFPRPAVNLAKHQLGCAVSWNLDALAVLWSTDKGSRFHRYTAYYARHLRSRRWRVRAVLEIGIGGYDDPRYGGQSLYMWRSYFPRATIYGLDIFEKQLESTSRIVVLQADQSDRLALGRAVEGCPPLDLIVDDGSHLGRDVITSFEVLFPRLKPGGLYAIEDVYTAYDPSFGGGPPGTPETVVQLTKDLLDDVFPGQRNLAAVHAYPGLVLVEKAQRERSAART